MLGYLLNGGELRGGRVGGRPATGDFPPQSSYLEVAGPSRPACRAADGRICRIAGGAVACWYRMVPDNVKDYRIVKD
jgi:hypothetical protein